MVTDTRNLKTDAIIKKNEQLKQEVHRDIKKNIRAMYNKLKSVNIKKANDFDEELKREYETMTDSEKALKDAIDVIIKKYDTSKDGMLNIDEFTKWFNDQQDSEIDPEFVKSKFGTIDADANNFISKRELFEFLKQMQ